MNKENNKLGMGLGALLNTNNKNKSSTNKIDISKIYPNKKQPRKNFEEKEIKELYLVVKLNSRGLQHVSQSSIKFWLLIELSIIFN